MLFSLGIVFLVGLSFAALCGKIGLPRIIGMLLAGVVLGPFGLDLLHQSLLLISGDLRSIALVIILVKAGLSLNLADLKQVGRPALLLSFLPACFEIFGVILLAPLLFDLTLIEAAIMGSVLAAVSPAVVVPRMVGLMEQGYGKVKHIPQMILAGASLDDVFVIVLFTTFTALAQGEHLSALSFLQIPISIAVGLLVGGVLGVLLGAYFQNRYGRQKHVPNSCKVIILLSLGCVLVGLEHDISEIIPMSAMLAVMSMAIGLQLKTHKEVTARMSESFSHLWAGAEVLLFVLVGAAVDIGYASTAGFGVVALIVLVLVFRMVGVLVCLIKTPLKGGEKLFCVLSYLPKATVQAAIGSVPLTLGLPCGQIVLTVAVVSILITAP